jgi:hypothetical protein
MGLMTQKDLAQKGAGQINAFLEESKLNKAQAKKDEEARIFAQNHPDPTKEEEGLVDPVAMFTPFVSDVIDVGRAAVSAYQGDWGTALMSGVAAIPYAGESLKAGMKSLKKVDADTKEEWQKLNKVKQRQEQLPELKQSAQDKVEGKITTAQHQANVDAVLPVKLITEVPPVPTHKEMGFALTDNKVEAGLVGKTRSIKQGEQVSTRLDIPAYDNYDTWVVSVHFPDKGTKNAYAKTASLKNVTFAAPPRGGYKISQGTGKAPIAMMGGKWQDIDPKKVQEQAKSALNSDEWVQVGYNPFRHSYFYDKVAKKPVVSATELIQVGPLVLARGVKYADPDDARFLVADTGNTFNQGGLVDAEMETLNFNHGGDVGEHPKTMAQEDRIEYVELGDNETLKSASLRVGIPQNQLLKWNMTATDEQRKQKRLYIPNSYYEAGGISNPKKITPESLTAKLNPKRSAYFEALKNKQAGVGTQVKEKASEVGSALKGIVTQATNVGTDKGFFEQLGDKLSDVYSALTVDTSTYDDEMRDLNLVEEPKEEVVIPSKSEATKDTTPSFEEGLFDWFSRSEGTVTATVNGVVTYPYGVEEGKFQGIDREAYKNEDGTYKDREFAIAVWGKHKIKLKENHPQWDSYPLGVREALSSYKWNYGLGNNVVSYAVAAAKEKDPVKQKALFKKSMTAMLDTFGATDKAKGEEVKGAMTGLVARRANDYNRAAKDLGYPEIATYSLSNQKDGTGAVAVYKDKDGMVISTQKSSYKIHTDSKAVTGRKINKSIASVDLTNWSQAIT